jgi:prolipoprotein diacylglyceryltransferase
VVCVAAGALIPGRSMLVAAALAPIAGAIFVALSLARRWLTGHAGYTLQQQVLGVELGCAAALALARAPVLAHLDLLTLGLCALLAVGRVGCFVSGCCFGVPSSFGVVYPEACHGPGPHPRRFPVQLVEAAAWVGLGAVGLLAAIVGAPGDALALTGVLYGLVRFALEGLRDDPRPRLAGLTEGRWLAILGAAAGFGVWASVHPPNPGEVALLGVGVVSAGILAAVLPLAWAPAAPSLPPEARRVVGDLLRGAGPAVQVAAIGPARFGVRRSGPGRVELSVSAVEGPFDEATARIWLEQAVGGPVPPLVLGERAALVELQLP